MTDAAILARLKKAPRLRRVYKLLSAGGEYSTLEITRETGTVAAGSACADLRKCGIGVKCRTRKLLNGKTIWVYSLRRPEPEQLELCVLRINE